MRLGFNITLLSVLPAAWGRSFIGTAELGRRASPQCKCVRGKCQSNRILFHTDAATGPRTQLLAIRIRVAGLRQEYWGQSHQDRAYCEVLLPWSCRGLETMRLCQ